MTANLREEARRLADQGYVVRVLQDETTDGQPIWLLVHPELPGCMAQGDTIEEAEANLEDARLEYIVSLLEDGLEVPQPATAATTTGTSHSITEPLQEYRPAGGAPIPLDDYAKGATPARREPLFEVVFGT